MTGTKVGRLATLVEARRTEIQAAVRRHKARSVAVFGSVARGDEHANSDVDFLVDFEPESSLLDLLRLRDELEALVGEHVDVVSAGGLLDRDEHIRREALPPLGSRGAGS